MFKFQNLKRCREDKELTQTDLVFELDKLSLRISRQTLLNWEAGVTTPDVNDIVIIASFFNKPVQYFFG